MPEVIIRWRASDKDTDKALCDQLSRHAIGLLTDRAATVDGTIIEYCTGIAATWCPIHGDCVCPRREDGEVEFDVNLVGCPLHGMTSDHGDDSVGD